MVQRVYIFTDDLSYPSLPVITHLPQSSSSLFKIESCYRQADLRTRVVPSSELKFSLAIWGHMIPLRLEYPAFWLTWSGFRT